MKILEIKKNSFLRIGAENFANFKAQKCIASVILGNEEHLSSQTFIEIALSMHTGSYALIGYVFEPSNISDLIVEVYVNQKKQLFKDTLALDTSSTYIGINEEYAELILKNIEDYFKLKRAPRGKLKICMGAYSEVCSSPSIFNITTNIIMDIFMQDKIITDENIIEICERHLKKRFQ
jgi:hypothetical protein